MALKVDSPIYKGELSDLQASSFLHLRRGDEFVNRYDMAYMTINLVSFSDLGNGDVTIRLHSEETGKSPSVYLESVEKTGVSLQLDFGEGPEMIEDDTRKKLYIASAVDTLISHNGQVLQVVSKSLSLLGNLTDCHWAVKTRVVK